MKYSRLILRRALFTGLLATFVGPPWQAAAQQPTGLETITVTASGIERQLAKLTGNLTVIGEQALQAVNHQHINQIMAQVPGAWISRGNGQEHLTALRSPVLTGGGGCGAFFMAQDGISLRGPGFCNINQLFDANALQAQRIEVLRGPASTLYGSNAVHGVINVITPEPLSTQGGSLGVTLGPHDYQRATFSASHQQNEHGFMAYGNSAHDGGYKDDSGFEQQKLTLIHQFEHGQWSVKNVLSATHLNQDTAGFIRGFEAYREEARKRENPNPQAYRDSQSARLYSLVRYQLSDDELLQVSPYLRWTDMEFLQHFLPWQPLEENSQTGGGMKLSYHKSQQRIDWLAGVDVDFTQGELVEFQAEPFAPHLPAGFHYDYQVDATIVSPYAKLFWQATTQLEFTAGMRYEYTDYDYQNKLTDGSACAPDVINCRYTRPSSQQVSFNETSYQLGASYQLAPSHRLYGQYSQGYRAPQATELFRLQAGQTIANLAPETSQGIELGVRGQSTQLFYDVSLFAMDKERVIFQDADRQNVNNGETRHLGIEFLLRYQLPADFFVQASGTLANHTYQADLTLSRVSIQGNEIDTAPQHIANVQLGWQHNAQQKVTLEWQHMGNYYLNPENTADYRGHNLLNLRASTQVADNLTVAMQWLNMTNRDYAERADFGFGQYRYFVGEPRSLFVSLNYQFD
ncbi:TonB-dependent receptor [Thalassotalea euphylliae]|uniref:TonB-dependent receptor n=1 Tax=Thalassotalea euphylliae TaxID=1655234 RepID=UPI0021638F9D|nr:TonB-dependent receptor [Thalassotalea euphylliae]